MRRNALGFLGSLLGLAVLAPLAHAQLFDVSQVANGVYAGIGKPGIYSNGAFIVNQDDVVVVDTHLRPSWAQDLVGEIRKVTKNPVRYVVNTHWHGDHTQGNQVYVSVFGPTVEYLAQHNTRDDLMKKGIPSVEQAIAKDVPEEIKTIEKILHDGKDAQGTALTPERRTTLERRLADDRIYLGELRQIQVTLPTMTFDKSLILHKPDRSIQILYFGKGHTRGDVVVYLPKEKVVVTGDLLTNGIPFMRDAYPVEWVTTLQALRNLDWDIAIPGHGDVQHGKDQIDKLISYLQDLVAAVKDAVAKGQTLEDAKKSIDLSKHAKDLPNFAQANAPAIERCWAEVTGKIQD